MFLWLLIFFLISRNTLKSYFANRAHSEVSVSWLMPWSVGQTKPAPYQDANFDQSLYPGIIHAPALLAMAKPLLLVGRPVNMGDWPALSGLRVWNLLANRI